ncbi:MAG: isochorismatase family protein [Candidatus Aminicenantes bacterium]|nr:isochorismatase family protein [Candidatus Aminicenantes bacterium]
MKKIVLPVFLLLAISFSGLSAAAETQSSPDRVKPALLVIDIQNAYLPLMDEKDKKPGMEMINYFIALFRANGFPVIRIYHTDLKRGPAPGSEEFEFPKTVAIRDDDPKVIKNYGNAFKKTELDKLLKAKGCNTVFLCGLSAVGCVLATYHGAMDLDYEVFMIKDALISHDAALTKSVQEICQTIDYYALKMLLENICR